jgi:soluble lytic murein transglycosylase
LSDHEQRRLDADKFARYKPPGVKVIRNVFVALLALTTIAFGIWWFRVNSLERSQDGPIRAAAHRYGVEPALVKAIVWRESRFNRNARGQAGELGLMQVQEIAAGEWADAEGIRNFNHATCLDPRTNTLAGTYYFAKLMRRYTRTDNPLPYALADYNAGRGNVVRWNDGLAATNSASFIQQITFPGTSNYVLAVMARYERYRKTFK